MQTFARFIFGALATEIPILLLCCLKPLQGRLSSSLTLKTAIY